MCKFILPKTINDVLEYKNRDSLIYAGGTDIMVKSKSWAGTLPDIKKKIIYIKNIDTLNKINKDENFIKIGSCTSLSEIGSTSFVNESLRKAILSIASPSIRNMATIGGNICNASPAGDSIPVLYALDAKLLLTCKKSTRIIDIMDFILEPGKTCLNDNEILEEIIIPCKTYAVEYFKKVSSRMANSITKVSFTGLINFKDNIISDLKISFGAVAPTIVNSSKIETLFIGKSLDYLKSNINKLYNFYDKLIVPINDSRSTAVYRKKICFNLLENFISTL